MRLCYTLANHIKMLSRKLYCKHTCDDEVYLIHLNGIHLSQTNRILNHLCMGFLGTMPKMFTATSSQAATYLLGVCLFSISFLVFLNSTVSFVIYDLIKEKKGVGNAVGTLGFADELVALVACPLWGILSDRIGVRTVSMLLREYLH